MGVLTIDGTLTGKPDSGATGTFPSGYSTVPFTLFGTQKTYAASTGVNQASIAINAAYAALPDIGSSTKVTHADTLYVRTNKLVNVRVTSDDGIGGSVVAVLPVKGLLVLEFDSTKYLKLVEIQGHPTELTTVEWWASGPS